MHFRVLLSVFCVLMYAGTVHASPFAYVANNGDNTVSVLDTATNTVVGYPIPVGQEPYGVAVNQQGSRVYVSNQMSKTISVIDTALLPYTGGANPVIDTIQLANSPGGLAVNAAGTRLFVALNDAAGVDVYNTVTYSKLTSVTVANIPEGIAAVQNLGTYKVLVTNLGSDSVSVINANDNTNSYTKSASDVTLPLLSFPKGIAVTSDGLYAYVANNGNDNVSKIDIAAETVSGAPISVGAGPTGVAISNDGIMYVTNTSDGTFTSYNLTTFAKSTFSLDGNPGSTPQYGPHGIAVAPSGRVYTANNTTGTVSVMTPAGAIYAGPVAVGASPTSLGKFMGPLLRSVSVSAPFGYGGSITPADPLVSLNYDQNAVLVADGRGITFNVTPDHNFATSSVIIDTVSQPLPLQPTYTLTPVTTDNRSIVASFNRTHWDLTITKNMYGGNGIGRVYTSIGGLDCTNELPCNPDGQTASISVGTAVTITAVPSAADNSIFIGWQGGGCSDSVTTCLISPLAQDTVVNARFAMLPSGPIRKNRAASPSYFNALADAYTGAASGDTLDLLTLDAGSAPFTLPNGFNSAINVTLVGGWTEWTTSPYGSLPAGSATSIQAPVGGLAVKLGSVTVGSYNNNGALIIK